MIGRHSILNLFPRPDKNVKMCVENVTPIQVPLTVSPLGGSVRTQGKLTHSVYLCCMLSVQHVGVGPMAVNATAARIVKTIQSVYQVSTNGTLVIQQLIMTFSSQISVLAGQPLSPEAQLHWYNQLQNMQLQNR